MRNNSRNKLRKSERLMLFIRHSLRQRMSGAGLACFIGAAALFFATSCSNGDAAHNDTYTCPMHPTVISDRPGSCPVCGMDLVRKARPGEEIKITEDLSRLLKSPNEVVVASIRTIRGEFKSVPVSLEATGVVTYDTRNIYSIPARVGGRLEKVYLKYAFQQVRKGQRVAEIYSPELVTAQRELLFLLENDPENEQLIHASRNKLELLGLTPSQVNTVVNNREAQTTFAIYSPYNGYVITGGTAPSVPSAMSPAASTGGGMNDMGGAPASTTAQPASPPSRAASPLVREGDYVSAGEALFQIVNTSALRIELDVPGSDGGSVSRGDTVTLITGESKQRMASVDFVQPFFSEGENFTKVRVYTKETEGLQIGQLVKAMISVRRSESLWVPREAVLELGTQQVVFIKDKEVLRPKTITTGIRSGGLVEIKSGLASSEEIAANAHYLVDSESFIKPVQ